MLAKRIQRAMSGDWQVEVSWHCEQEDVGHYGAGTVYIICGKYQSGVVIKISSPTASTTDWCK